MPFLWLPCEACPIGLFLALAGGEDHLFASFARRGTNIVGFPTGHPSLLALGCEQGKGLGRGAFHDYFVAEIPGHGRIISGHLTLVFAPVDEHRKNGRVGTTGWQDHGCYKLTIAMLKALWLSSAGRVLQGRFGRRLGERLCRWQKCLKSVRLIRAVSGDT